MGHRNARQHHTKFRKAREELIRNLKAVPCADCGVQYPPYVMDFDHRDPEEKLFTIGKRKLGSLADLLDEIAKCDVVCANCHRERTFGEDRAVR